MESSTNIKNGDEVKFGAYPQNVGGADATPIEWIILEHNGDELFLISKKVLKCAKYVENDSSWENSSIRKWLNQDFYDVAFTETEKAKIALTHCKGNGLCSDNGSPETRDRVFLLSVAEASIIDNSIRKAYATDYAKQEGVFLNIVDGEVSWWLRNRVHGFSEAFCSNGEICIADGFWVSALRCGLRMAIRIIR